MVRNVFIVVCAALIACAVLPWAAASGACPTAYPLLFQGGGVCSMRWTGPYCTDDTYTNGKCDAPNTQSKVCLTGDVQRTRKVFRPVDEHSCAHGCVKESQSTVTVVAAESGATDCSY